VAAKLRWIGALAVLAAILFLPAAAQATLVFVRGPLKPALFVANDDGSGAHRLVAGSSPHLSPDGQTVAYLSQGSGKAFRPDLMVAPVDGSAPPRRLIAGWRATSTFAWSSDSSTIAAVRGPELGKQSLVLVDLATGAQRTIAHGYFDGVSFAPEGGQVVYGRATSERFPPRSDLYRVGIAGGRPVALTQDHRSLSPLWGPEGSIVFVKLLDAKSRRYGPKNDLYLMGADGGQVRRLTHTKVAPLVQGLTPTQWSADGRRLLSEFDGEDTSYAVTVDPLTGSERTLTRAREQGLLGAALSSDGTTVLGSTGGPEPGEGHNVVAVPYGGGRLTVLAKNAYEPDWNR
jgi:Tol biopolymer transport system component